MPVTDASDTKYLMCVGEGKADFIVSGDHHLTDLRVFQGIRIVDPAAILAGLERAGGEV